MFYIKYLLTIFTLLKNLETSELIAKQIYGHTASSKFLDVFYVRNYLFSGLRAQPHCFLWFNVTYLYDPNY